MEGYHSPLSVSGCREEAVERAGVLQLQLDVLGGEAAAVNADGPEGRQRDDDIVRSGCMHWVLLPTQCGYWILNKVHLATGYY